MAIEAVNRQIAKSSASGFLAIPRDLFRACWRFLRLKEIALLLALIDLADGRWATPIALVELARVARLSAGGARETAAHLERAGLLRRVAVGPGIYRWELAAGDYLQIAHNLAHRPRLKAKPRAAQLDLAGLAFDPSPPSPPLEPPAVPRPRLALVPPPPSLPLPLDPPAASTEGEKWETPSTPPPSTLPPVVPAPPPPRDTEPYPIPEPYHYPPREAAAPTEPAPPPPSEEIPPVEIPSPPPPGPSTMTALGLSLGRLVELAGKALPDEREAPPPRSGAPSRPDLGRPPAPIQGASPPRFGTPPRPDLGRPHLMISKPLTKPDPKPEAVTGAGAGALACEAPGTGGTDGGKGWGEEERAEVVRLAVSLAPGLLPGPARVRLAALEAEGATAAEVRDFLEREIPAAKARGASYPFAAALTRWTGPRRPVKGPSASPAPLLGAEVAPPPVRAPGAAAVAPRLPDEQISRNLEGARAALEALRRVSPRPSRPSLEKP